MIVSGNGSLGTGAVTVNSDATLQLAGSTSSIVNVTVHGTGELQFAGANQTVGVIVGDAIGIGPSTYSGNTIVGNGSSTTSLTATEILQSTLTINAGSTVTIAPSGSGIMAVAGAGALTAHLPRGVRPLRKVAAIRPVARSRPSRPRLTRARSAVAGQRFENRIAAIERSATTDPGLDLSLLESRVLALLRSSSSNSSSELPSLPSLNDAGSNLPVLEPSEVFSGSNMSLATAHTISHQPRT